MTLREFAVAAFLALGVPDEDAANAANTLIEADMRGIGSHGMARLDRFYLTPLESELVTRVLRGLCRRNHRQLPPSTRTADWG